MIKNIFSGLINFCRYEWLWKIRFLCRVYVMWNALVITHLRPSREKYLCTWFWFLNTTTLGARTRWWQWRRIWKETLSLEFWTFFPRTYLEAGYMPLSGFVPGTQAWILCPKIELMLTMCPTVPCSSSRFFISRVASLVTRHNPMMFVSIVRYNSTVFLGSSSRPLVMTPALLIRRSTPPQTSSIHLKAALTWFSSRMSHSMQFKLPFKSLVDLFRTSCWWTCDRELERTWRFFLFAYLHFVFALRHSAYDHARFHQSLA